MFSDIGIKARILFSVTVLAVLVIVIGCVGYFNAPSSADTARWFLLLLVVLGVISAALDAACTYSAYTMIEPDVSLLTIEFKVNLMSPGRGERFLFRGEITKPGSTIIVADGRAYSIGDGPAKLIASMTSTMMALRGREGISG